MPTNIKISLVLIFGLSVAIFGQSSTKSQSPSGVVSGKVTVNDEDAAGIQVVLSQCPENRTSGERPFKAGLTDGAGHYRIEGIPGGRYCINAFAPAMVPEDEPRQAVKTFELSDGETADNVNLRLIKGGVVTGRVTDADGQPAMGVPVQATQVTQDGSRVIPYNKSGLTDDRGIYRIYGIAPGRFKISVGQATQSGGRNTPGREIFSKVFYSDDGIVTDESKAKEVEISAEQEATGIDIQLGHILRGFSASGLVIDEQSGKPIAGASIICYTTEPNGRISQRFPLTTSDAAGAFSVANLVSGHYTVQLSPKNGSEYYSDLTLFEINGADVKNIQLKGKHSPSLSGIVTLEGVTDPAVRAKLIGLSLTANSIPVPPGLVSSSTATIGPDGSFQFTALQPGRINIYLPATATNAGFSILRSERDGAPIQRALEVQAGGSVTNVKVILGYGNGVVNGAINVVGGQIPPSFRIYVELRQIVSSLPVSRTALPDARGHFTFKNIVPGQYMVRVLGGQLHPTGQPSVIISSDTQTITVSDNRESNVTLTVTVTPNEQVKKPQ